MATTRERAEQIRTREMNDPNSPYDKVTLVPVDGGKPDSLVRPMGRLKTDHTTLVELR